MAAPVLVACSHGTRDPAGRRSVAELRLAVGALRPGLEVLAAHVDVQKPDLAAVVARLTGAGRRCVVVPLLLSAGYHVRTDVARAVAASGGLAVAAPALGPDEALTDVLVERLTEAGSRPGDAVLLAAAASSDAGAQADVAAAAERVAARLGLAGVPVATLGGGSAPVADAVRAARREHPGARVAVATYLLSPGFFASRLADCGADVVAAPLGPHPRLAALALQRHDQALAAASTP